MSVGLLDTTVVIHLFRKYSPALSWFKQDALFSIASTTWMEIMVGAQNKRVQQELLNQLSGLQIEYLTAHDQQWAMERLISLKFSHGISINDALIASVAQRLQRPLYTHNTKDFIPMIGDLAIRPYE